MAQLYFALQRLLDMTRQQINNCPLRRDSVVVLRSSETKKAQRKPNSSKLLTKTEHTNIGTSPLGNENCCCAHFWLFWCFGTTKVRPTTLINWLLISTVDLLIGLLRFVWKFYESLNWFWKFYVVRSWREWYHCSGNTQEWGKSIVRSKSWFFSKTVRAGEVRAMAVFIPRGWQNIHERSGVK